MVSSRWKTLRQSFEQALAVMENFTRLSMHQRWRAHNPASKDLANGLMAETNPQYRDRFVKIPDDVFRNSRIGRRTRAGRNNDARGFQALDFFRRDLIVSEYAKVTPEEIRSEEHTSELQSHSDLVCRLLLEKKKRTDIKN